MNKIDCAHTETWDYKAWIDKTPPSLYLQDDWNQTLQTMMNRISAKIHQSTILSKADTILANQQLLPLIETLVYYKKERNKIVDMNLIVDNTIEPNIIYLYNESALNSRFVPVTKDNWIDGFAEIEMKPIELIGDEDIKLYHKKLKGYIEIVNYE